MCVWIGFSRLARLQLLAPLLAAAGGFGQLLAAHRFPPADAPVEDAVGRVEIGVVVAVVRAGVERERVAVQQLLDVDVVQRRERRDRTRGGLRGALAATSRPSARVRSVSEVCTAAIIAPPCTNASRSDLREVRVPADRHAGASRELGPADHAVAIGVERFQLRLVAHRRGIGNASLGGRLLRQLDRVDSGRAWPVQRPARSRAGARVTVRNETATAETLVTVMGVPRLRRAPRGSGADGGAQSRQRLRGLDLMHYETG